MATLTAEVTKELQGLAREILRTGLYKSQSEVVRDAIRQLALKYHITGSEKANVRRNLARASKKAGTTLSGTLMQIN